MANDCKCQKKNKRKPSPCEDSGPGYNEASLKKIGKAVDCSFSDVQEFRQDFERARSRFLAGRRGSKRRPLSELQRDLETLEKQLGTVAMKLEDDHELLEAVRSVSTSRPQAEFLFQFGQVVHGIRFLQNLSNSAAQSVKELKEAITAVAKLPKKGRREAEKALEQKHPLSVFYGRGRKADLELDDWIRDMLEIFKKLTGRPIATSVVGGMAVDAGNASGPLVRFVMATSEPLEKALGSIEKTPNSWRDRIRKVLTDQSC